MRELLATTLYLTNGLTGTVASRNLVTSYIELSGGENIVKTEA
jgi:hypothetical protein